MVNSQTAVYARRGLVVRVIYLLVALVWWLLSSLSRSRCPKVVVLNYHGVTARQRHCFQWQMKLIASRTVSVHHDEGVEPASHTGRLPNVCVTFDDAFECLLDNALPVTRALNTPVAVFVVSGNLGRRPEWHIPEGHPEADMPVMSRDQIKSLANDPLCRLGSHTVTHPLLTSVDRARLESELTESKSVLGDIIGYEVKELAFPHGCYTDAVLQAARSAGYQRMFTIDPCSYPENSHKDLHGRFVVTPDDWPIEFFLTIRGAYAWLHPWRSMVHRIRRSLVSSPLHHAVDRDEEGSAFPQS